jgi:membrane-bound serine protease (ClpP class)
MRMIFRAAIIALLLMASSLGSAQAAQKVLVITIDGVIGPVASEYISNSLKRAEAISAEALIIELDTPGGLMDSMRHIIKDINASKIPTVVFVSPSGARAASAGAFITIAAHVAAMTPQSNIGAAHPVASGGGKMDETMSGKVTNDAVAYIRSLAEARGRNMDWAEQAVRNSISSTASVALQENVIDLITENLDTLLIDIDGREVLMGSGTKTLNTKGAEVVREEMGFRYKLLGHISNPNVAYVLMLLGFYGLFFELSNPGAIFPGVIGGISLILAFYAFQTLPVNYAGLLLIILAVILFVLETQITSSGVLSIGGLISMFIGSVMLFDSAGPLYQISMSLIMTATITTAIFMAVIVKLILTAHKHVPFTGIEGLVGLDAIVQEDVSPDGGTVKLHGEIWSAYSDAPIATGEKIIVEAASGLKVKVKIKKTEGGSDA